MASLELDNVSFSYPVYDATGRSLKVSMMRQLSTSRRGGAVEVQALSDIDLRLTDGDRVGLIGRNGAGKSTMLKLLAGLIHPRSGKIIRQGRIVPLIARGLGIHPELTGYQNIELPMRLLGAKSAEIRAAKKEIPEWVDIGDFIHLPMRTYSEGMRARFLFAVLTAVRGDILIMDEWLGAGDATFVSKAEQRISELVDSAGIVVLSSHSMSIIKSLCNVAIWIDEGRMVMQGEPDTVIGAYFQSLQQPEPALAA